jgi:putative ABC transport system substrate-binding protein
LTASSKDKSTLGDCDAASSRHHIMQVDHCYLSGNAPVPSTNPYATAFREGLGEAGYVEGQNVAFENRWADGHFDKFPAFVADLIGRKVDLIVAIGDPAAHAAKAATQTIPIVFVGGDDRVAAGFGASMARPMGNLTGVTVLIGGLNPKRLELLQELVPKATVIALLVNPRNQATGRVMQDVQEAIRPSKLLK